MQNLYRRSRSCRRAFSPERKNTFAVVLIEGIVAVWCPELNRFFYKAIGGDWYWIDRLPWTYEL